MMERREKGGREEDGDGRFAFKNHGDVDEKSEKQGEMRYKKQKKGTQKFKNYMERYLI